MRIRTLLAVAALLVCACSSFSDADAVEVVRRYNARLIEAYRAGDVRLVDPLVGEVEGKRLTGLIGVNLDEGITLDAELLELQPTGVERRDAAVVVSTRERWYYRNRKIGTREQVGPDSTDSYVMRYWLGRVEGRWVVERTEFAEPPQVGRGAALQAAGLPPAHGGGSAPTAAPPGPTAPHAAEDRK